MSCGSRAGSPGGVGQQAAAMPAKLCCGALCPAGLSAVRRVKLEQWVNEPFFEDTLPGCMVRLAAMHKSSTRAEVGHAWWMQHAHTSP